MKDRADDGPEIAILRDYRIQRVIMNRVANKLRQETEAELLEAINRKSFVNSIPTPGV